MMKSPDPRCKRNIPKMKKGKIVGYYGFECSESNIPAAPSERQPAAPSERQPAPYIDPDIYKEKPRPKPKPKPKPSNQMPREISDAELIKILQGNVI